MPKLPIISGAEVIKKLQKHGYNVVRQKGSHVRLHHFHKTIKIGLLSKIIKDANLTVEEFVNL